MTNRKIGSACLFLIALRRYLLAGGIFRGAEIRFLSGSRYSSGQVFLKICLHFSMVLEMKMQSFISHNLVSLLADQLSPSRLLFIKSSACL